MLPWESQIPFDLRELFHKFIIPKVLFVIFWKWKTTVNCVYQNVLLFRKWGKKVYFSECPLYRRCVYPQIKRGFVIPNVRKSKTQKN